MIAYFLPGTGIFGGIKAGFRFADALDGLGLPIVVATPDGDAPAWFSTSVPILSHSEALARLSPQDPVVFSLPHDYPWLRTIGHPLVFHCQGTDQLIDPIIADPEVLVLTCWQQAHDYVREHAGRDAIDVGISVGDAFFYAGEPKREGRVAFMPRRGGGLVASARAHCPSLEFVPIEGLDEAATARTMQGSDYFLATSVDEWFGLPSLEAMAAGCVVVSVPVLGGMEYLSSGRTAIVTEPEALGQALAAIADAGRRADRLRLRHAGLARARAYRQRMHAQRLAELLAGPLAVLT